MKYANIKFKGRNDNNLGDNIQLIAIDEIYKRMGINLDDVEYINLHDLGTYSGDYVVLPITMPMMDYVGGIHKRFSDRIIPVFFGLTLNKLSLEREEVDYLRRFEPIGCRDEWTLRTVRKYGIESYLHGCITITLPKREINEGQDKIFIVDVDEHVKDYIPKEIQERAVFVTHHRRNLENPKIDAKEQLEEYENKAKLVITSLMHATGPCLGMGIPVIMLREHLAYRLSWLDRVIPIYTADTCSNIDWNPEAYEIDCLKEKVLELSIERLRETYIKYDKMYSLSFYYEDREQREYVNEVAINITSYLSKNWNTETPYKYSIWGCTQIAEYVIDYISEHYPNAELKNVYDKYRRVNFKGKQSKSVDEMREDDGYIIATFEDSQLANETYAEYGIDKSRFISV